MFEEFLGGRGIVGTGQFCGGEIRVERDSFIEVLQGILRQELFRQVAPLQIFLSRVFGLGGERDFASACRRRGSCPGIGVITGGPHGGESQNCG